MRNVIAVIVGLATWLAVAYLCGVVIRATWPAYVAVADSMAFTLPMMFARLSVGVVATVAMGFVTACITRSKIARIVPGVILLAGFIPEHVMLWDKFPVWYHAWFLLSLVPLTYAGNLLARGTRGQRTVMPLESDAALR